MALWTVTEATHLGWPEIIARMPDDYLLPALNYPGFAGLLDVDQITDPLLQAALRSRMAERAPVPAGKG